MTTRTQHGGNKMKNRFIVVVAVAAASLATAIAPAGAQPNQNASCAAQLGAHGELGNPGEYQRTAHDPSFGQRAVKFVATFEGDCSELGEE